MSNPCRAGGRVYNFNPGPATLPLEVLEEIRDGFMDFGGTSVLEISHRGAAFRAILDEAQALVRELLGVPKDYHILFLQGGASQQFAQVPMNLMARTADYAITGSWAKKAFAEARHFGEPKACFSSEGTNSSRMPRPEEVRVHPDASYLHITSNETIAGSQYRDFPDTGGIPLVADMSSDILSRPIDVSKFGLIYAGAQKNLGAAGVTLVVIRDDLAKRKVREVPRIFSYEEQVREDSLANTPPVFAIYVTNLVLRWAKRQGGLKAIEEMNREKAAEIYAVLDASSFYRAPVERDSRSQMNVVFLLPTPELTDRFVMEAEEAGMVGLAGHRSVGGIRASLYNAFPLEGAKALARFMREFEQSRG